MNGANDSQIGPAAPKDYVAWQGWRMGQTMQKNAEKISFRANRAGVISNSGGCWPGPLPEFLPSGYLLISTVALVSILKSAGRCGEHALSAG
jgi:hypothetical protein